MNENIKYLLKKREWHEKMVKAHEMKIKEHWNEINKIDLELQAENERELDCLELANSQ